MPPMSSNRPIVVVAGPTAGGKTALAVALAHALPDGGECINADSMQVYRGMDIGTAKPSASEQRGIPHHLLDVAEPDEPFTLEAWHTRAEEAIADVRSRGRWPIVVGGSNLHIQALLYGLLDAPEPDRALRDELGLLNDDALRLRLEAADPEAALRIHRADRRRTIRALEVAASGATISSLQTQWSGPPRSDALFIGLDWSAEAINRRINRRVRAMVDAGLVEEVRRLEPRLGAQAREALGYRQLLETDDLDAAIEQIKIRTRRFAKQQRTWLRRFHSIDAACWLQADESETQTLCQKSVAWIQRQGPPATSSSGGA